MLRVIYEWTFDYLDRLLLLERFYQFFSDFFSVWLEKKMLETATYATHYVIDLAVIDR